MVIDIQKVKSAGYMVDVETDQYGELKTIHFHGDNPAAMNMIKEALLENFPNVNHDSLVGVAYEAVNQAIGFDIIAISSKG